jgi:hypothetical protein
MIRNILLVIALLAALLEPASASAHSTGDCDATIEPSTRLVRVIYDPFEAQTASASVRFEIRAKGKGKCAFAVSVSGML